ncbi:MAG: 4Fe-4S binding protein [Magnetococcales bacterium]|nr:4Fe-4S binding protein [Nitrospirota bacterium]
MPEETITMTEKKEKDIKEIARDVEKYKCAVQKAIMFLDEFIDGPMCARCLPCPMGSYEMRIRMRRLADGKATELDVQAIRRIAPLMLESSMCKKGKDTAKFIIDTIENSPNLYSLHVEGVCPDKECKSLIVYKVIEDKCVSCDECRVVCKDFAIVGERKKSYLVGYIPYEIVDKRCSRCGLCISACTYGAIEIVDAKAAAVHSAA